MASNTKGAQAVKLMFFRLRKCWTSSCPCRKGPDNSGTARILSWTASATPPLRNDQVPARDQCGLIREANHAFDGRDLREAIGSARAVAVDFDRAVAAAVLDQDEVS